MVAPKGEIVLYLPTQHHLCILQRLVIQQPVRLSLLCRGVAVLVLNGDAIDGNSRAVSQSGFHPVVSMLQRQESRLFIIVSSKT